MRNLIKKILKEQDELIVEPIDLAVGDVVIVNGYFQGKYFNDNIGVVRKLRHGEEIVSIEFDNWHEGHNGTDYKTDGNFWELYSCKRYKGDVYDYTIERSDVSDVDFFNQLKESIDEFDWVRDIINSTPINIGDVFYIVDDGVVVHKDDYRPRHVRYVIHIDEIEEGERKMDYGTGVVDSVYITKTLCNPYDFTYKKEDYQIDSPKCKDYHHQEHYNKRIGYNYAVRLMEKKYWRKVG